MLIICWKQATLLVCTVYSVWTCVVYFYNDSKQWCHPQFINNRFISVPSFLCTFTCDLISVVVVVVVKITFLRLQMWTVSQFENISAWHKKTFSPIVFLIFFVYELSGIAYNLLQLFNPQTEIHQKLQKATLKAAEWINT